MKEESELPSIELLDSKTERNQERKQEWINNVEKIQRISYLLKANVKVENVCIGPNTIEYQVKPEEGIRVSKIKNLKEDFELALGTRIIGIKVIPEKYFVGIEVERINKEYVSLREIVETSAFENSESRLTVAIGVNTRIEAKVIDIAQKSPMLVSGTTGSGKSMFLHSVIISILYKAKSTEVKFMMIDTKATELTAYEGIPHLLIPVITDASRAVGALAWICHEMESRYMLFSKCSVKNIKQYNEIAANKKLCDIVLIIDEYADLLKSTEGIEVENSIYELTKKARNVGIHLILVTERPSIDILKGNVKANITTRAIFKLPTQIDSRVVLDQEGAEQLLGNGDMLYKELGEYESVRYQSAFVSHKEIERIVDFLKTNEGTTYSIGTLEQTEKSNNKKEKEEDDIDEFLTEAIELVVLAGQVSTSFIQRRFKIGYARAGRIIDQLEERGIISKYQGEESRKVLMSKERWQELKQQHEVD